MSSCHRSLMSNNWPQWSTMLLQYVFLGYFLLCLSIPSRAESPQVTVQLFNEKEKTLPKLDLPITNENDEREEWSTTMRSFNGKAFSCTKGIPKNDLLESNKNKPICILSNYDHREYWQYEVCLGSNVSQVHIQNGKVQSRVSLGKLASSTETLQVFEGGSGGRQTKIHFHCDKEATKPRITRAEEPKPLHYEINIATKVVCNMDTKVPLASLPCMERVTNSWHARVCPRKSVVLSRDALDGKSEAIKFTYPNLVSSSDEAKGRKYEVYNSTEKCPSNPDEYSQAKVAYICSIRQQWPMLVSFERTDCHVNLRVIASAVCDSVPFKIECSPLDENDDDDDDNEAKS